MYRSSVPNIILQVPTVTVFDMGSCCFTGISRQQLFIYPAPQPHTSRTPPALPKPCHILSACATKTYNAQQFPITYLHAHEPAMPSTSRYPPHIPLSVYPYHSNASNSIPQQYPRHPHTHVSYLLLAIWKYPFAYASEVFAFCSINLRYPAAPCEHLFIITPAVISIHRWYFPDTAPWWYPYCIYHQYNETAYGK